MEQQWFEGGGEVEGEGEEISSNSVLRSSGELLWAASHFLKQLPLTLFLAQRNEKLKNDCFLYTIVPLKKAKFEILHKLY